MHGSKVCMRAKIKGGCFHLVCSVTIVIASHTLAGSVNLVARAGHTTVITVMSLLTKGAATSVLVIVAAELVKLLNCLGFGSDA